MHRWWLLFAQLLAGPRAFREDGILRSSICYKAVTEALNARRELFTGERGRDRAAALKELDSPLQQRLSHLASRRFLPADEVLAEETCSFLLRLFTELWDGFAREPFLRIRSGVSQEVDGPREELPFRAEEEQLLEALERHIATGRGGSPGDSRRLHAVRSAFWNMDDLLFIVDADRDRPPGFRELAEMATLASPKGRLRGNGAPRSFLFLRLGQVAFPLTPMMPADLHRGLLTPATMPDVFLQLGVTEVWWSDYAEWYLSQWQTNEQWQGASGEKKRQLALIAESARQGRVVYPLTPAAVERAARRLPDALEGPGGDANGQAEGVGR
jgi:PAS domain-containing protein